MNLEKLQWMKDSLICVVENQLCNLDDVDTEELGEAIDMIKDLEEAIYYNTVTEAMNNPQKEIEWEDRQKNGDHMFREWSYPPLPYDRGRYNTRNRDERLADENSINYYDELMMPDEREGRSHHSRKMYIEARDMKKDKAIQLRELEKYMQELSQDIVEMIEDASPEERQYLEKKITALASKIGQMK